MNASSQMIRTALVTLLSTGAPLSLLYMLAAVSWFNIFGSGAPGRLVHLPYPVMSTVCLLGWVYFAFIAAVFPCWLYDVTKRIAARRYLPLPFSATRAAMVFFIPVQQIGLPFYVVNSLRFRAQQRLSGGLIVRAWWLSWLFMFSGAVRTLFVNNDPETVWVYGGATIFCILSLMVVFVIEHALSYSNSDSAETYTVFESPATCLVAAGSEDHDSVAIALKAPSFSSNG